MRVCLNEEERWWFGVALAAAGDGGTVASDDLRWPRLKPLVVGGGELEGNRLGFKRRFGILWIWKKSLRDGGGVVAGDGGAHGGCWEWRGGDW